MSKLPKRNNTFVFILCTILVLSIVFTLNLNQPISTLDNDQENLVNEKPPNLKGADEYIISEVVYDHLWSPDGTKLAYIKPPIGEIWNCEIWIADKSPTSAQLTNHQLIYTGAQHDGLQDWKGDWLLIMIRFEEGTPSSYYGRNELWKIKTDGTALTQITFTETNGIRTTWSNSVYTNRGTVSRGNFIPGTSLVYFSAHDGNGWYKSYVCNDDGSDGWYHISNPDYAFGAFMSPPGNKLLWTDASYWDAPSTLRSSNIDGSDKFTIKSFSISLRGGQVILADGSYFIWHDNDNIYAIGLDGTNEHTVIDDAYINYAWNYNPVNTQELIISSTQLDGNNHLFKIDVDGTDLVPLTDAGPYNDEQPILSPNGEYVSYLRLPYDFDKESNSHPYPYEFVVKKLQTNDIEPELTDGDVSPKIGDQNTEFNFTVRYSDEEDNAPSYVNVLINGTTHAMEKVNPSDTNYTDGCLYQYLTYLLPSEFNYSYYFECSDDSFINITSTFNNLKVEESNFYQPKLISAKVVPTIGNHLTLYNFTVWYFDDDNNLPSYVNITLNSSTYSMQPTDRFDLTAYDGIEYYFEIILNPGYYQFQITCSDGYFTNTTDWINAPEVNPFYNAEIIQLISPFNESSIFSGLINFTWYSFEDSIEEINYSLQISTQEDFSTIILEVNNIEQTVGTSNFTYHIDYSSGRYYWRVRPYYQTFTGEWSDAYQFNLTYNENAPTLNLLSLEPSIGDQNTIFNFSIIYQDLDNNTPYFVNLIINGTPYSMEIANPLDDDYTDGCIYYYTTTLPFSAINYTYSFECSDGKFDISTATYNNLEVNQANYESPHLLNPQVTPQIGGLSTIYHFQVVYMDLDDNFPEFVNITIDDHTYAMIQFDLLDTIASDGILFYYDTILDIGLHTFQINCSDGLFSNSTNTIYGPDVNPLIGIEPVELYEPVFFAQITNNIINFSWYSLNLIIGPVNYTLQISDIYDFSNILYEIMDILETSTITNVLVPISLPSDDFFWRVRATYGDYNGTWSNPSRFTYMINSEAPLLTLEEITPSSGTESTVFKITILYTDSDNNAPNYVRIRINGIPYNMTMVDPDDDDFTNGCIFQFLTFIEPSDTACTISFECFDGLHQYSTSNFEGPIVEYDEIPGNNLGENNFNSANTFAMVMTIGITIGCLIPFIAFTEILTRKVKLGTLSSKKIKKKEMKPK